MDTNETILRSFFARVWNTGGVTDVAQFSAPAYIIHSDPGDPWDGQTLSREQFCERMITSRAPFPDLAFSIDMMIDGGDCVVVSWVMSGTHRAALGDFPATGRITKQAHLRYNTDLLPVLFSRASEPFGKGKIE